MINNTPKIDTIGSFNCHPEKIHKADNNVNSVKAEL